MRVLLKNTTQSFIITIVVMVNTIYAIANDLPTEMEKLPASLGNFNFSGNEIVLETTLAGSHPRVVVDLGDGEKYKFIVDTGASVHVMDATVAKKMGYDVIGNTKAGAPGGKQIAMDIVRVPQVKIGNGKMTDAEFLIMDLNKFSMGSMQGVIGMGLFREFLLTFDMGNGKIVVSRDSLSADDPGVIAYESNQGHIMIELNVAGTLVKSHIDTGAMGSFILPGESLSSYKIIGKPYAAAKAKLVGGERDIVSAQIDGDIKFAGLEFNKPMVSFMTPSTGYGNIGGDIFSQMVMPIDQKNHLIGFHKTQSTAAVLDKPTRRLGVAIRGMGTEMMIGKVELNSLGEKVGFKADDKLVTLNGINISDYEIQEIGALIKGTGKLNFEVERQGKLVIIEVD